MVAAEDGKLYNGNPVKLQILPNNRWRPTLDEGQVTFVQLLRFFPAETYNERGTYIYEMTVEAIEDQISTFIAREIEHLSHSRPNLDR